MYAGTVALRMSDGEVCVCRRNEERGRMTADSCVVLRYNVYVQVAFYSVCLARPRVVQSFGEYRCTDVRSLTMPGKVTVQYRIHTITGRGTIDSAILEGCI